MIREGSVDENQVYLVGYSMGGYGVWSWVAATPNRFAAALSISGAGLSLPAVGKKTLGDIAKPRDARLWPPMTAIHGDKDDVVPVEESIQAVQTLQRRGGQAKFIVWKGRGHYLWEDVVESGPDQWRQWLSLAAEIDEG